MKQPIFTPTILQCSQCGASARCIDWNFNGKYRVMCENNHALKGENNTPNRAIHKWNNAQKEIK